MIVYSVAEEYTAVAVQSFKDAVVYFFYYSAPHPICSHPQ